MLAGVSTPVFIDISPPEFHSADVVAQKLEAAVKTHFGDSAPKIQVVEALSANALASASRIRLRPDARFTDRDADQLLHPEAHIHVATALNGQAQTALSILSAGHPGTTRTQKGLAVVAEVISDFGHCGSVLELSRDRVAYFTLVASSDRPNNTFTLKLITKSLQW